MARHKEFDPEVTLEKAVDLLWSQGYEKTSVQDLVEHLGIGRGSLYNTYGGKQALYLAALDRYRVRSVVFFRQQLLENEQPSIKTALRTMLTNMAADALSDPLRRGCFLTNATAELAAHNPEVSQRVSETRLAIIEILQQAFQQAQKQGQLTAPHEPYALACYFFNAFQGLRVIAKSSPEQAMLHNIVEVTLSVLE